MSISSHVDGNRIYSIQLFFYTKARFMCGLWMCVLSRLLFYFCFVDRCVIDNEWSSAACVGIVYVHMYKNVGFAFFRINIVEQIKINRDSITSSNQYTFLLNIHLSQLFPLISHRICCANENKNKEQTQKQFIWLC